MSLYITIQTYGNLHWKRSQILLLPLNQTTLKVHAQELFYQFVDNISSNRVVYVHIISDICTFPSDNTKSNYCSFDNSKTIMIF